MVRLPRALSAIAPFAATAAFTLALTAPVHASERANPASDAPEGPRLEAPAGGFPATYADALARWRTPGDIDRWIGASFRYDAARARRLSESERARSGTPAILAPDAFYADPAGVCVDLARFGVEALAAVDPAAGPRYLMIEFDPSEVGGDVLRRHWVATRRQDGGILVYADSKRPGHVAGPYASIDDFARDYAAYRGRRIVSVQERESYARTMRATAPRRERSP
jgi:hypothetical protein